MMVNVLRNLMGLQNLQFMQGNNMAETKKQKAKVKKVMKEFKKGKLHQASKKGPKVTNPKQAIAIGLSEAGISKKKKNKK